MRILVIDSCRSGAVTRVKGGRPAPPILLGDTQELDGEGVIVLTASAAGEDAQESDQLGGSFFTHYLLSGLRGAADDNGDQVVTVAEAFSYTRDQHDPRVGADAQRRATSDVPLRCAWPCRASRSRTSVATRRAAS